MLLRRPAFVVGCHHHLEQPSSVPHAYVTDATAAGMRGPGSRRGSTPPSPQRPSTACSQFALIVDWFFAAREYNHYYSRRGDGPIFPRLDKATACRAARRRTSKRPGRLDARLGRPVADAAAVPRARGGGGAPRGAHGGLGVALVIPAALRGGGSEQAVTSTTGHLRASVMDEYRARGPSPRTTTWRACTLSMCPPASWRYLLS